MGRVLQIVGYGLAALGVLAALVNCFGGARHGAGNIILQVLFMILPGLLLGGVGSIMRKRGDGPPARDAGR